MTDDNSVDADVELLADALLDVVQDDIEHSIDPDIADLPPAVATAGGSGATPPPRVHPTAHPFSDWHTRVRRGARP